MRIDTIRCCTGSAASAYLQPSAVRVNGCLLLSVRMEVLRVSTARTWDYGFCMVIVPLRWASVRARDALGFRLSRTIDASRTEQWMEGMRKKRELPLF